MTNNRIWFELERPRDDAHAEEICTLANTLLAKLDVVSTFFWSPAKASYCFGGVGGFTELSDNGQWLNLDYLGTAPAP